MFRFAGFELDPPRVELRGPDGGTIKLRPKAFEMLRLLAVNAGRVLDKQELLQTIWPNVHVGDDSLFQCIREVRSALGDERRQMIKLVSGRGYMFAVEVAHEPAVVAAPAEATPSAQRGSRTPTISVMPFAGTSNDDRGAALAAGATDRLIDGLARIDPLRVVAPWPNGASDLPGPALRAEADFVVRGELQKGMQSWTVHARMIRAETGEVQSVATVSVDIDEPDTQLQQTRLAAGVGHPLALHLNARLETAADRAASAGPGTARIVIEQALAANSQTTRERSAVAEKMLENALSAQPDNLDLQLALATLQLRGIQMVWYDPAERLAIERRAKSLLEQAMRVRPDYIPVLDAYCRFLNATNQFVDNLISCAKTLRFDPWNGVALYHLGLAQLHLGRFEDALATFDQAYRFDTPTASRWTWPLGAAWACTLMGRSEEALPWLQRSLANTVASGRTHMLLAAIYQRLGLVREAKAAMAKGLELRPGSTARNVRVPEDNTSPIFVQANDRLMRSMVAVGLPEG